MVSLGLYMTNEGKTRISTFSEAQVHHVWGYLGFVAETLIFVVTGVIIGHKVLKSSIITWKDYLFVIPLYLLLHIIRFFTLFIFWPILKKTGYGLNFNQLILLSFAGLRGAVGMALALLVANDPQVPEKIREVVLFLTAGVAFLTILVNGVMTGPLIKKLGLSRMPVVKKRIMNDILDSID